MKLKAHINNRENIPEEVLPKHKVIKKFKQKYNHKEGDDVK